MLEELSTAQKVVGVKQSLRALREGRARKVFLACDADPAVTGRVEDACASVPVERNFTMAQLGSAAGIAVGAAVVPLFFGLAPLTSTFWEAEIPVLGHVEFVTSTIFDIGVYLVVIGLVLDVLRSLGAEVDRQLQEKRMGVRG